LADRERYGRFLSEPDKALILAMNNRVAEAAYDLGPLDPIVEFARAQHKPIEPYNHHDIWLRYGTESHVAACGEFVRDRILDWTLAFVASRARNVT
jgi:hypothetical protein